MNNGNKTEQLSSCRFGICRRLHKEIDSKSLGVDFTPDHEADEKGSQASGEGIRERM
jgi:hypothetical protein